MHQAIYYFSKQSLPHGNGTHLPHLFLNSTYINSNKNKINVCLYHAPGDWLFYKTNIYRMVTALTYLTCF